VNDDVHVYGIGIKRVQLLYAPGFESGYSWDIREQGAGTATVTSIPADGESAGTFRQPDAEAEFTLYRSEIITSHPCYTVQGYQRLDYPSKRLQDFFVRLRSLSLPISPLYTGYGGADGIYYELALYGDLNSSLRFTWWSESPEQWKEVVAIGEEMVKEFRQAEVMVGDENS